MIKTSDFTFKRFVNSFKKLDSIDGLIDVLYNSKCEKDKDIQERSEKIQEIIQKPDNQIIVLSLIYKFMYDKEISKFDKFLLKSLHSGKTKYIKYIINIYLIFSLKLLVINSSIDKFFSNFNESLSLCIRIYSNIKLNRPLKPEEKNKLPYLVFNRSADGANIGDTFIDYIKIFFEVRRFCIVEGGLSEQEVNDMQIVSLFYYFGLLTEQLNGGRNNGSL